MATTNPVWIEHPGFYLKEEMGARGWTQRDLAFILGVSEQAVNLIVGGKRGISAEMARALGDAFDVNAELFANLQRDYEMARTPPSDPGVAVRARLQSIYPVREMVNRGWLHAGSAEELERQLAAFFEVAEACEIPYLTTTPGKGHYAERGIPAAQVAWLYRVRQLAAGASAARYSASALRKAVGTMESWRATPEEASKVPQLLADCGVRLVAVEQLAQAEVDGACLWLNRHSPVIGLSLKRDSLDHYWFVLRHEIEHVLRGDGREDEVIDANLGGVGAYGLPPEETAANAAATVFCGYGAKPGDLTRKHTQQAKIRTYVLAACVSDGWGHVAQPGKGFPVSRALTPIETSRG